MSFAFLRFLMLPLTYYGAFNCQKWTFDCKHLHICFKTCPGGFKSITVGILIIFHCFVWLSLIWCFIKEFWTNIHYNISLCHVLIWHTGRAWSILEYAVVSRRPISVVSTFHTWRMCAKVKRRILCIRCTSWKWKKKYPYAIT